jgi:hypothetical protein
MKGGEIISWRLLTGAAASLLPLSVQAAEIGLRDEALISSVWRQPCAEASRSSHRAHAPATHHVAISRGAARAFPNQISAAYGLRGQPYYRWAPATLAATLRILHHRDPRGRLNSWVGGCISNLLCLDGIAHRAARPRPELTLSDKVGLVASGPTAWMAL